MTVPLQRLIPKITLVVHPFKIPFKLYHIYLKNHLIPSFQIIFDNITNFQSNLKKSAFCTIYDNYADDKYGNNYQTG